MTSTWIVLVPPIIVVLLAASTRRIVLSLLTGIFLGVLIVHNFSITLAVPAMVSKIWLTTELGTVTSWKAFLSTWYLLICLFLLLLGILITLISSVGGAYAYADFVSRYLKKAQHAECASLILSLFFFIDDYFSCLTVGSVMRTVTDRFNIPRVKIAFLVNAMGAPLAVLIPLSSWVAEIIMQLRVSGVSSTVGNGTIVISDPFSVYSSVIPFLFYAIITLVSLWFVVLKRISFGVLKKHENVAQESGNLFAGKLAVARRKPELDEEAIKRSSLIDFIFPLGLLVILAFLGILYFGEFSYFGGSRSFVQALQNANTAAALFSSALITVIVTVGFFLYRAKMRIWHIYEVFKEGIGLMGPSVFILILIWTLSNLLKSDLGTGKYLASLLIGAIPISLLPALFFLVGVLTSSSMGSAWGAIGILIPIGIPMLVNLSHFPVPVEVHLLPVIFPLIGAIVSGALVGNHLSPISDTMLMSSASAGAYHIDLVRAQFDFTVPTIISTTLAFVVSGLLATVQVSFFLNILVSWMIGIGCNMLILYWLDRNRTQT